MLDSIHGPRDLRRLDRRQLDDLAQEIREFLVASVSRTARPPRPQPRRRRAHPGAAPGVRLAARPDPLGHRPPGVRPQDRHRPGRRVRPAAAEGRAVRLPEPGRVRPRRHRELARVDRAVVRRRAGQGVPAARRDRPARRRGRRRRVADRRDGLGGAEQHRRRPHPAPRHRRQRQRALLLADHRRARAPPRDVAHHPRLRAVPRVGQAGPRPYAGRRPADLRRPARREEGPQGRRRAAGHVRGPGPEVHRADRRPRRRGRRARAAPGPRLRRAGPRALHHPQGPRLQARRGRRGRPLPRHRRHRPRDRPAAGGLGHRVDEGLLRRAGRDRRRARRTSSASPPPCSSPPGWTRSPRPTRTGSSTSASPSSTRPPRRPGWRSAACTRWSRSTRPSSTGRSTRC